MGDEAAPEVVPRATIARIVKDVKDVIDDETLHEQHIYYAHNMDNFMYGNAMIVGPRGTPYEDGFFFFMFTFPVNYPYEPPRVRFCNVNDDKIRYNPNLYTNGKVCLSILNTWSGDQWTACQSIRSVLLTLCTVFNERPLLNEPGISETHSDHSTYNEIVRFNTISRCHADVARRALGKKLTHRESMFTSTILEYAAARVDGVTARAVELSELGKSGTYRMQGVYRMSCVCDYDAAKAALEKVRSDMNHKH